MYGIYLIESASHSGHLDWLKKKYFLDIKWQIAKSNITDKGKILPVQDMVYLNLHWPCHEEFFSSWVRILFCAQVNLQSHSTFSKEQSKYSFYTHSSVGSPSKQHFVMSLVKGNSQHIFPLTSYTLYETRKGVSVSMLIWIS